MNDIHNQSDTKDNANFAIVTLILFPVFLLIGFYFFFYQTQSYLNSVTEKYAKEVSEKNKGFVDRSIDDILTRIKTIALVIDNRKGLQSLDPVLSKMEERGLKDEFQALRVLVIDKNGNASTGDDLRSDFSHREYFKTAMTGIANVSQHIYDIWSKKSIHVFASPIIFNGNVSGVAALTITRETLNKILQKSSTEGESSFYVVQKDGFVISQPAHQNQQWAGSNIADIFKKAGVKNDDLKSIMDKNRLKELTGKIYKFSLPEKSIYISISKSKHNDWYIISISPDSFVPTWYKYFLHVAFAALIIGCLFFILIIAIFKLKKEHDKKIHRILFDDPITEVGTTNSIRAKYNSLTKEKNQEKLIFIAFDIIGFKVLNLYAGRDICDKFLKFIAHSTSDVFDKNSLIARTSADNFIIITRNNSLEKILVKIDLLSNKIHENKLIHGAKIAFGIYEAKDHHELIDDCIDRANLAKITSKLQQKNGATVCFDNRMIQNKLKQQNVEASMHAALLNREFKLYLQPKVRLSDNKIIGAEALVRWIPSNGIIIPPSEFINIFEENGFIYELDCFVLEETCRFLKSVESQHPELITPISINISRTYIHRQNLVGNMQAILKKAQVPCKLIDLEITETSTQQFSNLDFIIDLIEEMRTAGFSVSIDDFGSGYSSLRIFSKLPIDSIKFDRDFFGEIGKKDMHVIKGFVEVAHALKITTIAEGIEKKKQIDLVKDMGFDVVQGYFYSKPLPINEYLALIKRGSSAFQN